MHQAGQVAMMANARRGITRSPDSPVTAAISRFWRSASTLSRLITVFEESLEFLIPVEYRFLESLVLLILVSTDSRSPWISY